MSRTRKPDPPRSTSWRPGGESFFDLMKRLAVGMTRSADPAPATAPPPPRTPKPPAPPPPPPRRLTWDQRCGWHIPSNLSQAELASTEPSEQTLRMWRAVQEKFEAEARKQAQQEPGLPPNFKRDPMGRIVHK
jgi:hypothetical protein